MEQVNIKTCLMFQDKESVEKKYHLVRKFSALEPKSSIDHVYYSHDIQVVKSLCITFIKPPIRKKLKHGKAGVNGSFYVPIDLILNLN